MSHNHTDASTRTSSLELEGTRGDDILTGGAGNDELEGGRGNDTLVGGAGSDELEGGKGNDLLDGGTGNDELEGGKGNDTLLGGAGHDELDGGKGNDVLDGGTGNDELDGGKGNDILDGGTGNDELDGGKGNDILIGGAGNDEIDGGRGTDIAVFSGSIADYSWVWGRKSQLTVTGTDGIDKLKNIEILRFDDYDYSLAENNAPIAIVRSPVQVEEGASLEVDLDVYDFDGDAISVVSATSSRGSVSFVEDLVASKIAEMGTSEGVKLTFDAGTDFDYLAEGEIAYETVTLTLRDSAGNESTKDVQIEIVGKDDQTEGNAGPVGTVVITGIPREDEVLTADASGITDADGLGDFSYQWLRDGTPITGATSNTYLLTQADVGALITVVASYTDGKGTNEAVRSDPTDTIINVNDLPTGGVSIEGSAVEGETLTANTSSLEDEDGLGPLSYQWLRDGEAITDATADEYQLTQEDVGAQISLEVTYTDLEGTPERVSSMPTANVANVNDLPVGEVLITGTAQEDEILRADASGVSDADGVGAFSYQWLRDGVAIAGATGQTYQLAQADVGKRISVEASYLDGQGTTESVTSQATEAVVNVNDDPTGSVLIRGSALENEVLEADTSTLADEDGLGPLSYQWLRNGDEITGATADQYQLTQDDVGAQISVRVSYTDLQGTDETVTSEPTVFVSNVNNAPVGPVLISGVAQEDELLTADASSISDLDGLGDFSYQWQRDGEPIAGATGTTYRLTQADVGKKITVVASYKDGQGTEESVHSDPTDTIINVNDLPTGFVSIDGGAVEGETLTANTSSLADEDGLGSLSYQWQRGGIDIVDATAGTYELTQADVGAQIRVVVSYTDLQGTPETVNSTPTANVVNVNDLPVGEVLIDGNVQEDEVLTANARGISDEDGVGQFSYQWLRDGVAVAGATEQTYQLVQADVGKKISVKATYLDGQGTTESVTSAETEAVLNVNDDPTGSVLIRGSALENEVLEADTSALADEDGLGTFSYQWLRDGVAITDATADQYQLTQADVGAQISVRVSYTDLQGTDETVTSLATDAVINVNDDPVGTDDRLNVDPITDVLAPSTNENTSFIIDGQLLLANDTDPDSDTISIESVSATSALGATITLQSDGSVTYDPRTSTALDLLIDGESSEDTFTYTIKDGLGGTDTATVILSVSGVNDPPIVTGVVADQVTFVNQGLDVVIPVNLFTDHDGESEIVYSVSLADGTPLPTALNFSSATNTLSYVAGAADQGAAGIYRIKVTGIEAGGLTQTYEFTVSILDGQAITGTDGPDTIDGTIQGDLISGLGGDDTLNGFAGADVLDGGAGNDRLNGGVGNDILRGGDGNDNLIGGDGGDELYGGDGDDYLQQGSQGSETSGLLDGGAGNDRIIASTGYEEGVSQTETLIGGDGDDLIDYVGFNSEDTVDAGAGDDIIELQIYTFRSYNNVITLGSGADTVVLDTYSSVYSDGRASVEITDFNVLEDVLSFDTFLANRLQGWDGSSNPFGAGFLRLQNDGAGNSTLQIDVNGGADSFVNLITFTGVTAEEFTDANFNSTWSPDGSEPSGLTLSGTESADVLDGGVGADLISGLGGDDTLNGFAGADVLDGGAGNDRLNGGVGNDILRGGDGNDNLIGGDGADELYGGDGDDYLQQGSQGSETSGLLDGGAGNDRIIASTGYEEGVSQTETLIGGDGDDLIDYVGFNSEDTVDAGAGDDIIELQIYTFRSYNNVITLGSGADTVVLDTYSSVYSDGRASVEITDFNVLEDVLSFDTFLANRLQGWDGSSNPFGAGFLRLQNDGAGNSTLQIDVNGGADSFVNLITFTGVTAEEFTDANFNSTWSPDGSEPSGLTLSGTESADVLDGGVGADLISGLGGDDTLNGFAGADVLDGGAGNDRLNGGVGNDILRGGDGNDNLIGGDGGDELYGGDGDDYLQQGSQGSETSGLLDGGAGNDRIIASTGYEEGVSQTETLIGGDGDDLIDYVGFNSEDTVDAGAGDDIIELQIYTFRSYNNVITLGSGADTVVLDTYSSVYSDGRASVEITDFNVLEDVLSFDTFLANRLQGWDGSSNPFGAGFLRQQNDGAGNSSLQIDVTGGADSFINLINFTGVTAEEFASVNTATENPIFGGYRPDGGGIFGQIIDGTDQADTLEGTIGDDTLNGLAGNDTINGGNGNDQLNGGSGNDVLSGGFGADTFVFALGDGFDRITDFELGIDSLFLTGGQTVASVTARDTDATGGVDSLLVEFGDGSEVLLSGVTSIQNIDDLLA